MRQRALKGFRGKQEFSPNDFGGSTPPKSTNSANRELPFDCCGAVKRAKLAKARPFCKLPFDCARAVKRANSEGNACETHQASGWYTCGFCQFLCTGDILSPAKLTKTQKRSGVARTLARERIFGSVPRDFGGSTPPKSLPAGQSRRRADCKVG